MHWDQGSRDQRHDTVELWHTKALLLFTQGCNLRNLGFHWSAYACSETKPLSCVGEIFRRKPVIRPGLQLA